MNRIAQIKIHPSIGIARLGDHPTATFDGPQKPFDTTPPSGGYKKNGQVKRQAAVFRLFGYDSQGKLVKEITAADADITWSVELGNRKAAWQEFQGLNRNTSLRNGKTPSGKRHLLNILPTPRSVNLSNPSAKFDDGSCTFWNGNQSKTVKGIMLGELKMSKQGELRVLAGFGISQSPFNTTLTNYANNDGWCDDVADGPVNATVMLHGTKGTGQIFHAVPSWVLCGPPHFAPPVRNVVTLYDTLLANAVRDELITLPPKPSFAFDVYPLLKAALDQKWVHDVFGQHTFDALLKPNSDLAARKRLFNKLRTPAGGGGNMPLLLNDKGVPSLAVTQVQFDTLKKWTTDDIRKSGIHGQVPQPPAEITPDGMDQAALQSCVGGALFPGIESCWLLRDVYNVFPDDPFRLNPQQPDPQKPQLQAGDIVSQMALPWQADFFLCRTEQGHGWWPAVRPDDVFFKSDPNTQKTWATGIGSFKDMVNKWSTLGFVVKVGDKYLNVV